MSDVGTSPPAAALAPIAGVRVLEIGLAMSGPYCTMLLGDLGAEVIKIERAAGGDESRNWPPFFSGGESHYFRSPPGGGRRGGGRSYMADGRG